MKTSLKPRVEMLEDRLVPATVFSLDQFEQNIRDTFIGNTVGFAYAINQDGVTERDDGWGDARKPGDGQMDFTESTQMTIASVSKTITATSTLKILQDTPGVSVDSFIAPYLPTDWVRGPDIDTITFRELLTHHSGLRRIDFDGSGDASLEEQTSYGGLQQLIGLGILKLPDDPDSQVEYLKGQFSYENANFALMRVMTPYLLGDGDAADNAADPAQFTADAYVDYVCANVLAPMGINGADTAPSDDNPTLNYTYPGVGATTTYGDRTLLAGGEGWWLSADELAKFLISVRNNDDVLSPATRQLMRDNFLGWMDPDHDYSFSEGMFGTYYSHGGDLNNLNTAIMDFPNNVQVALLVNSDWDGDLVPHGNGYQAELLKRAFENAWPEIDINGTSGDDTFEVRLNPNDNNAVDIFLNGGLVVTRWAETLDSLTLNGLGGNDTFLIEDLPAGTDLILDGGADDDTFTIGHPSGSTFDYIFGNLSIIGGGGVDRLDVNDANGIGEQYSIFGINNPELAVQGIIGASNYTPSKMFLYGGIEELVLVGNTDPNQIKLSDITSGMTVSIYAGANDDTILVSDVASGVTVNLFGEGGDDTFKVWNVAPGSTVNVFGDMLGLPGGADTLTLGNGDLGTVQGSVFFEGAGGADLLVLDDSNAPSGRIFQFTAGSVTASGGFGGVAYSDLVEKIRLEGSSYKDIVNVESLGAGADLDLYGHKGDDIFYIAGQSHNVDLVDGDVVIHGGNGYAVNHEANMPIHEDDDQVYVFDDKNALPGSFTINLDGSILYGRLNKLGNANGPALNVIYDQIERTELHTDAGANTISVLAAPWFNQVSIYAGGGNDQIDIESTPLFAAPMQIFGEGGEDSIRISPTAQNLGNLRSPVSIHGGSGAAGERDQLSVYDTLSANAAPYELSSSNLSRAGSAGIDYDSIEDLFISLSNADNVMNISSTAAGTKIGIDGNGGDDTLIAANLASSVTFVGGAGVDRVRLIGTNGNDTITVSGETMTLGAGSLTSQVEFREVNGLGGVNRLNFVGTAGTNETFILWPSPTPYAGRVNPNPFTPIAYEHVEEIFVQGNAGDSDTLQINGQTQAGALGGGAYNDRFDINLAAAGTSSDPFLVLLNSVGKTLLTLTDYQRVGVPKINGLLGADIFDVRVSSAGPQSRSVQLDGGGEPFGLKGDQLHVHYTSRGANAKWVPTTPKNGKIAIDYMALAFAIDYQDMESIQLLPI